MAVAPTGRIFNGFEFDSESSKNYSVYITGEAVYNAPEREVEMISIPGRNGAFALDKGRFKNIEVTYPAGIFADNELDFARAVSNLRNYLCSKKGYCRLTDDYNPDEYRLAIYKSGLEVDPAQLKAGEFDITFECKPQRYLMSGETPMEITSGENILNPTLFDSQPLIEVEGYGDISFGDFTISITDEDIGDVTLLDPQSKAGDTGTAAIRGTFNTGLLSNGDTITFQSVTVQLLYKDSQNRIIGASGVDSGNGTGETEITNLTEGSFVSTTKITGIQFTAGTQVNPRTHITTLTIALSDNSTVTAKYQVDFMYAVSTGGLAVILRPVSGETWIARNVTVDTNGVTAVSTASILGHPTYIDCELGEAYKIENDGLISLNRYIDLGSDLPVLTAGVNTFTYDNTITDLKVTPRWWKV